MQGTARMKNNSQKKTLKTLSPNQLQLVVGGLGILNNQDYTNYRNRRLGRLG